MREIGVALKGAKIVMGLHVGLVREVGFRQIGGNDKSRIKGVEWRSMTQGSSRESYRSSRWTFVESIR